MDGEDWNTDELRRGRARLDARLAARERLTGIILGCLTFLAVMAIGLLLGHVASVPWLSRIR